MSKTASKRIGFTKKYTGLKKAGLVPFKVRKQLQKQDICILENLFY